MPTDTTLEDKFATLFHPSTPRASPTSEPSSLPSLPHLSSSSLDPSQPSYSNAMLFDTEPSTARPRPIPAQHPNRLSLAQSLSSNDSFGSFVSVRPDEDPLASSFGGFVEGDAAHDSAAAAATGSKEVSNPLEDPNPTLRYFDHYAQQAKEANEARGREVLGELMRYEEEGIGGLFRGGEEGEGGEGGGGLGLGAGAGGSGGLAAASADDGHSAAHPAHPHNVPGKVQDPLIPLPPTPPHHPHHPELPHSQFSLDDIDTTYFSPPIKGSPSPILASNVASSAAVVHHPETHHPHPHHPHHPHPHHPHTQYSQFTPSSPSSPRLLSTPQPRPIAAPTHVTASPIPSSSSSTPIPSSSTHPSSSTSLSPPSTGRQRAASEDTAHRPDIPKRSSSYQTLSSISAKWIPSLFSVKPPPEKERGRKNVQDVFSQRSPSASPHQQDPSQHLHHAHTTPLPHSTPPPSQPRHISSLPPQQQEITHASSPFASHVSTFAPISGAPGFRPEYDWDVGYSGELEREVLGTSSGLRKTDRANGGGNGNGAGRDGVGVLKEGVVGSGRVEALTKAANAAKEEKMAEVIERRAGGVELVGRKESTVGVLTPALVDSLRPHLPALARLPRTWTLLYSLDQHGISINTLYARCEAHLSNIKILSKGMLVIIRDSGDCVFGCWIGEGVRMSRGRGYSGGGESFLFRVEGGGASTGVGGGGEGRHGGGDRVKVWKWTGRNDYVSLCENEYLSFGGGDGHYGLYIDSSLYDGSSAPCPTFGNEPLCSPGPRKAGKGTVEFECVGLEVWGLGS